MKDSEDDHLKRAVNILHEHWDSALVLVTRYNESDGSTISRVERFGNYFTTAGQAATYLRRLNAKDVHNSLNPDLNDE